MDSDERDILSLKQGHYDRMERAERQARNEREARLLREMTQNYADERVQRPAPEKSPVKRQRVNSRKKEPAKRTNHSKSSSHKKIYISPLDGGGVNEIYEDDNVPETRSEVMRTSAKQRKMRKKRIEVYIFTSMIVFAVAVVAVLAFTVLFKVSGITCENTGALYSEEEIIAASGISEGSSIILLNTGDCEDRIEKLLPYIEKAEVKRILPEKIKINVSYAEAALSVSQNGSYTYLSSSGKVLETGASAAKEGTALASGIDIPAVAAGESADFSKNENFTALMAALHAFEENEINGVTKIDVSNVQNIIVTVNGNLEVSVGGVLSVGEKLKFGKEVIMRYINRDSADVMVIDLTMENRAYVRKKTETPEDTAENGENSNNPEETKPQESATSVPDDGKLYG